MQSVNCASVRGTVACKLKEIPAHKATNTRQRAAVRSRKSPENVRDIVVNLIKDHKLKTDLSAEN
jgi:hypothetical protein